MSGFEPPRVINSVFSKKFIMPMNTIPNYIKLFLPPSVLRIAELRRSPGKTEAGRLPKDSWLGTAHSGPGCRRKAGWPVAAKQTTKLPSSKGNKTQE